MNIDNELSSSQSFSLYYAGRELSCVVERRGKQLDVLIDNDMTATLQIEDDGKLRQVSGHELGEAIIAFIKKQVMNDNEQTSDGRK